MNSLLQTSRVVLCALEELPVTLPVKKFMIIDDAHNVSEPEIF